MEPMAPTFLVGASSLEKYTKQEPTMSWHQSRANKNTLCSCKKADGLTDGKLGLLAFDMEIHGNAHFFLVSLTLSILDKNNH